MSHCPHPNCPFWLGRDHHRRLLEAAEENRLARQAHVARRRHRGGTLSGMAAQFRLLLAPGLTGRRIARRIGPRYRLLVAAGMDKEDAAAIAWRMERTV
ncbi:MAG: hypothetical protein ACP5G2_06700 [Candidatus Bipolaricaulaceae bacterium]